MNTTYLPAICGPIFHTGYKLRNEKTGSPLTFWENNSFYKYPNFLVSAWYGMRFEECRKTLRADDSFIIGDSGGFQAVSQGKVLDPLEVIKWQNTNCDVGLILDVPPYEMGEVANFGKEREFEQSLLHTLKNAEIMKKNKADNLKLYGVVQGQTPEKALEWFRRIEHVGFDGWALAPKPSGDPDTLIWWLKFAYDNLNGADIHILQIGTPFQVALVSKFSHEKYSGSRITFDNSSPDLSANFKTWTSLSGDNISIGSDKNEIIDTVWKEKNVNNGMIACPCPVCKVTPIEMFQRSTSEGSCYITLHNLFALIHQQTIAKSLCSDTEKLVRHFAGEGLKSKKPILRYLQDIERIGTPQANKVDMRTWM